MLGTCSSYFLSRSLEQEQSNPIFEIIIILCYFFKKIYKFLIALLIIAINAFLSLLINSDAFF